MTSSVTGIGRRALLRAGLALPLLPLAGRALAADLAHEHAHDHVMADAAQAAPVAADTVKIDNFSFLPQAIVVPVGTKVTWTNADDIPHTVTEENKRFKSPPLDTDDQYSFTFSEPGEYRYFCSLHSKMTGTVKVMP